MQVNLKYTGHQSAKAKECQVEVERKQQREGGTGWGHVTLWEAEGGVQRE